MENEQWKEDILNLAYRFAREGQERIDLANGLRVAVGETDQQTCLALVAAFLERLVARRAGMIDMDCPVCEARRERAFRHARG